MAKLTKEEILAYLDEATILELNDLVKAIEEKYGVSAAAPVAVAAAPAEAAEAAAPANVTVVLSSFGDSKVGVIKVVRAITGLGLVDAKKLVDAVPSEIKKDVPVEEAENIKKQLVEAGATVEFK
ncbi:MAG: 50S ribosomal protein L7/L12 [Solobacterium sp.]|nr:50S ribosomal protein L7/L12 [Solobacterium sp.]